MDRFALNIIAFFLCTPIAMIALSGVDFPLSDVVCALGVALSIRYFHYGFTKLLYLSILLSLLSSYIVGLSIVHDYDIRALFSVIYFYKPYFAVFVAFGFVRDQAELALFLRVALKFIFLISSVVIVSIFVSHHGIVRLDSEMNGNVFGVPLYGSFGVNSLAVFYLLLYFVVLLSKSVGQGLSRISAAARWISLFALSYMIILSLSREALLGYIFLNGWYLWKYGGRFLKSLLITVTLLSVATVGAVGLTSEIGGSKWTQITESVQEGDMDKLSSGRITLYKIALSQLANNVLLGNGFHGFQLYTKTIEGYETVEGLSPHNQYITSVWKMGLVAAIPYFFALYSLWSMRKNNDPNPVDNAFTVWLIVCFFVLANVWDVLIIPNFAALTFFLWGAVIAASRPTETSILALHTLSGPQHGSDQTAL